MTDSNSSRPLDPVDRISEVLFGLFMVLTFTGTLSVLDSGRDEVLLGLAVEVVVIALGG
jgi:hypothetical protein